MKILAVASEIYPLVKTGGLADVVGALPLAMKAHGVDTMTLIPGYPAVMEKVPGGAKAVLTVPDLFGGPARLHRATIGGLDLLILDAPHLFERPGSLYGDPTGADWPDNWRRFAALGRMGAQVAQGGVRGYRPDLVHVHDWQAAMIPAYLRFGRETPPPSVITIHNLAFQGQFDAGIFDRLGLPPQARGIEGVEYYGGVGFLKAGLRAASAITTVSPTYAQEIRTPEFGMGLEGLMNARADRLTGIVNGIDIAEWNPATDAHLTATYDATRLDARVANRRAIEKRFSLDEDGDLLICLISRLTWQKGIDVVVEALDEIAGTGVKLALLGSGDAALEGALHAAAARYPGRIGVAIGYDEVLSHRLQGGSDAILVPSRFEPCGLTQLYGLRYGCLPIVARTGGLADTVIDANEAALNAGVATGFQFSPLDGRQLLHAIDRAVAVHRQPETWEAMQKAAMSADVSWDLSAARYVDLYRSLIAG